MLSLINNIFSFGNLYIAPWTKYEFLIKNLSDIKVDYQEKKENSKIYLKFVYNELSFYLIFKDTGDLFLVEINNIDKYNFKHIASPYTKYNKISDIYITTYNCYTFVNNEEGYSVISRYNYNSKYNKNLAMYILVNKDIEISKGKLAGQVGHSVMSYIYNSCKDKSLLKEYMEHEQTKILLACPQRLLEEYESLGFTAIRDNGKTELTPNTLTCVNIGIVNRNDFNDKKIKRLRLYK